MSPDPQPLATGAEVRVTNAVRTLAVVCNGGQARPVEGTWSASLEWLVASSRPACPTSPSPRCGTASSLGIAWRCASRTRLPRSRPWRAPARALHPARVLDGRSGRDRRLAPRVRLRDRACALDPGPPRPLGARREAPHRLPRRTRSLPTRDPGRLAGELRRGFERAQALAVEGSYSMIREPCIGSRSALIGAADSAASREPLGRPRRRRARARPTATQAAAAA